MPPRTTKRRTTTNVKTKTPEVTENRTVWKSDNQGVKKETFIQTGRRGRDGQPVKEDSQQGRGLQTGQSHICVQIKWEEQPGNETDNTTQGSSAGK